MDFLDTNVLIYSYLRDDVRKHKIASALVVRAILGEAVTSAGVLGEFASVLLHKLKARPEIVLNSLQALSPIRLVSSDGAQVRRAMEAHQQFGVHFYDGLIIAAAERAGAMRLLTEDLNHGQAYFGVQAHNPFRE